MQKFGNFTPIYSRVVYFHTQRCAGVLVSVRRLPIPPTWRR